MLVEQEKQRRWLNTLPREFGLGESAPMIFDTMQFVFKMDMVDLGALNLKEAVVDTENGLRAGQDYGKAVGEKFAN